MARLVRCITAIAVLALLALAVLPAVKAARAEDSATQKLDPAAWGDDHVGKTIPDYVTGDECLFCHRSDVGTDWVVNRHARTIRFVEKEKPPLSELAKEPGLKEITEQTTFVLGRQNMQRLLKEATAFGHFDISNLKIIPGAENRPLKLQNAENPSWDSEKFAASCAGCHATAVETEIHAFGAFSLDCYACHGSVSLEHTNDTKKILLSRKRDDPAPIVASICGQCHLRGGKSKSTGLPYPNQFIGGDNLFKDYEVNFSDEYISKMNPGDRHIYRNIKDIVVNAETRLTCLNCHEVHSGSSKMHLGVKFTSYCLECHLQDAPRGKVIQYEVHSDICEY